MKPGEAYHWQPQPFAFPDLPDALCQNVDPELFYPDKGGATAPAKRICRKCYERDNCLQWALDRGEEFGVWGGLGASERKKLRKKGAAA